MNADDIAIPLRWADADAYGHVHHSVFLSLIEHARVLWLIRTLGSRCAIWDHATVRLAIDYRAELLVQRREVLCAFHVSEIGNSSISLTERMRDPTGTVVADLQTVIVAWVPEKHTTRALTDEEREVLLRTARHPRRDGVSTASSTPPPRSHLARGPQ